MEKYLNKWLFLGWQKGIGLDYIIHPDDDIDAIGLIYCFKIDDQFLHVKTKEKIFRLKPLEQIKILPNPMFDYGDQISLVANLTVIGAIDSMFWHFKQNAYNYLISVDGKRKTRRYTESELVSLS